MAATQDQLALPLRLLLNPISPGAPTINFKGKLVFTKAAHGFDYTMELDVTYNLTVK